ncbi:zinc-dependent dehydrogenase [Clostridium luticellarii]|jgi:L-iditol 2-dehydrogenase|uniref:zinc-dependent dehydrogenase n=1 Tax=Clostridium luticellarii TaxID=1691940 RepID=UPI002354AEC8|nr:zinc-dependent dehydrogenase [Clostridium luticellarii]MCI1995761.1 zinc-dependent dehydrogenase [Clostridium luticellarii]
MKAAVYGGIGKIEIKDIEKPKIEQGTVLIKVKTCAICGGDLRTFRFGHKAIKPPIVLGHEIAGEIVEVASDVKKYSVGQRVIVAPAIGCGSCSYCLSGWQNMCYHRTTIAHHYNGGFEEYMLVPAAAIKAGNINYIPDEVTYLEASLAEPLACVLNAQEVIDVKLGNTVAVIGAGPIGCMHAEVARAKGAGKVFIINRSEKRLESTKKFGFDEYICLGKTDAVKEVMNLTDGLGANVVIVTAGSAEAEKMGINMASKMGKVCFFAGLPKDQPTVELDSNLLHYRQITVYGTFSSAPRHNALALEMIRSGKVSARDILTHVVTLDKIVDGMKLVKNRDALRVSVTPCIDEIGDEFKKLPGVKVVK